MLAAGYFWNYRCNLKGCCCKTWRISFREYDVHRLRRAVAGTDLQDLFREALQTSEPDPAPVVVPPASTVARFGETFADVLEGPDGGCRFLSPTGACRIHETLGEAALPDLCVNFPIIAVETPEGVECYFEFVCPEVLRCLIEAPSIRPVAPAPATFTRTVRYFAPARPRDGVWLTRDTTIPWEMYARFRRDALAQIETSKDPPLALLARLFACVHRWAVRSETRPVSDVQATSTTLIPFLAHLADVVRQAAESPQALARRLSLMRQFLVHLGWPVVPVLDRLAAGDAPRAPEACSALADLGDEADRVFRNYLIARVFSIPVQNENSLLGGYLSLAETVGLALYLAAALRLAPDPPPEPVVIGVALGLADFAHRARQEPPRAFDPVRRLPPVALSPRPGGFADVGAVLRAQDSTRPEVGGFSSAPAVFRAAESALRARLRAAIRDHAQAVTAALQDPDCLAAADPWTRTDDPLIRAALDAEVQVHRRLLRSDPEAIPAARLVQRLGLSAIETGIVFALYLHETDTLWTRALTHAGLDYEAPGLQTATLQALFGPCEAAIQTLQRLEVVEAAAQGRHALDATVLHLLLRGQAPLPDEVQRLEPDPDLASNRLPPPAAIADRIARRLSGVSARPLAVLLLGASGHDPRALIRMATGREVLAIRVRSPEDLAARGGRIARVMAREARLRDLDLLVLLDMAASDDARSAPALIEAARANDAPLFIASQNRPRGLDARIAVLDIPLEPPSASYLTALAVRSVPRDVQIPDVHGFRQAIAGLPLPPSSLVAAVLSASNAAVLRRRPRRTARAGAVPVLSTGLLVQALRDQVRARLGDLAESVAVVQGLQDLVLPAESLARLREMISGYRHREKVLRDWGFAAKVGRGGGWTALFFGPPGTGKTMAAGIVARELGLEVYRVDLSRVVDKYIGETEKHLRRVFDEAERGQVMLLFDEADSLFGKRTSGASSATDRYANMEVNYLLQRMERYEGVVVLTTNNERLLDEAFRRRLRYVVQFPMPDAAERERLWRGMIPAEAEVEGEFDFAWLARQYEMSGGHIRNAVLRAAYQAAEEGGGLSQERLRQAADAEYRALGRVVREARPDDG